MTNVLLYHDVTHTPDEVGFDGPLAARYKLAPDVFERHLDALADAGVDIGLLGATSRFPDVALTFDDGGASALDAARALERRGWRGHFFIPTSRIGTQGFLPAAGIRELVARGHVVGSHSHTHPTYMGKLTRPQVDEEWRESRNVLERLLDEPPTVASVPGGLLSRAVIAAAEAAGYRLLLTSEPLAAPGRHGSLVAIGRYGIWSTTPPERAARYAVGDRRAQARLWVEWKLKGAAKRVTPRGYQALRRVRAIRS